MQPNNALHPLFVILAVACGGAAGSMTRVLTKTVIQNLAAMTFPAGILGINIAGSFCMGCLAGFLARRRRPCVLLQALAGTGFLGGFTTVSSFVMDTLTLYASDLCALALLNVLLNIALGVGAAALGLVLMRTQA